MAMSQNYVSGLARPRTELMKLENVASHLWQLFSQHKYSSTEINKIREWIVFHNNQFDII